MLGFFDLGALGALDGADQPLVIAETAVTRSRGWPGDYYHPGATKRRKRVDDTLDDLVRSYEDATGITAEREREAAIREIKRAAATALSVANQFDDAGLAELAQQIMALRKFELTALDYIARVGDLIAQQDNDDMEAVMLMARLV